LSGYEWDEEKNRRNRQAHGVDFSAVERFEWGSAIFKDRRREDYGELRDRHRLHRRRAARPRFTRRNDGIRIISLRKANKKEKKAYVQGTR
jgi:uncharacterized DUF497 family protein